MCRPSPLPLLCVLAACVPRGLVEDAKDRDDDGYVAWQLDGDDCNDAEATANPGENELCGDEIDNNCDGVIDDDGTNAPTWYPDLDGDGFAVDAPVTACVQPANHRPSLDAGVDCDDSNGGAHPGGTDAWYDGIDADCGGNDDYDQDGDGYRHPSGGGADCDDLDDEVSPEAIEVCGNHADDNCDGTHDACDWSGTLDLDDLRVATIAYSDDSATVARVAAGNIDGDAALELAVSGMDREDIYLFDRPLAGVMATNIHADIHIVLPEPPNIFGYALALDGDLDSDGRSDLLIGNGEHTDGWPVVRSFVAPLQSEMDVIDVSRTYYGPDPALVPDSWFGETATYLGDLHGDGFSSWWVSQQAPPRCYLMTGVGLGTSVPAVAPLTVDGCKAIAPLADLDADDITEIAVYDGTGTLRRTSGAATGTVAASSLPAWTPWPGADRAIPKGPAVDFNQDGQPDLLLAAAVGSLTTVGVAFGPMWSAGAATLFEVVPLDADDGLIPIAPADVNGDGIPDLVALNVEINAQSGQAPTSIVYFAGPLDVGEFGVAEADASIALPITNPLFIGVLRADIDADGFDDIVVGHLGFAWVIYGEGR